MRTTGDGADDLHSAQGGDLTERCSVAEGAVAELTGTSATAREESTPLIDGEGVIRAGDNLRDFRHSRQL